MKALIALCATLLLFACGNCHAQWSRVDASTIRLDGDIDRASYANYRKVAEGGFDRVILRSAGGSPLPALMIADDIRQRGARVRVEDYCMSSCANYLLISSPAPEVACGALVAWHGGPGFRLDLAAMRAQKKNPNLIAAYAGWVDRFERLQSRFYATAKVDPRLLTDPVEIVDRAHIAPESKFTLDDMTGDYSETVSTALWIPTTDVIRAYRIDTRNFCATYDADIAANLKARGSRVPYTSAGR